MKKQYKLLFLCLFFFLGTFLQGAAPNAYCLLCDHGKPSCALLELLAAFDVPHDGSWNSIVNSTQKLWLRKEGSRLYITPETDPHPEKTYALFSALGMTATKLPSCCDYDYACIHGTSLSTALRYINFLKTLWEQGVRFKTLVLLSGNRPLDPTIETVETFKKISQEGPYPTTEAEMLEFLIRHLSLPKEWATLPLVVVNVCREDGKPNTRDTLIGWLDTHPQPGSCLMLSGQPFIPRQDLLAQQILPPSFCVETVGPGFSLDYYKSEPRGLRILQDELARLIYQLNDKSQ